MWATALTSEAQYFKLTRGQPSPFDTAIAVRIDRYREEGLKLKYGQQLVDSLVREVYSLNLELSFADSLRQADQVAIDILTKAGIRKDSIQSEMKEDFDKLYDNINKPKKFFERPSTLIGGIILFEVIRLFIN